MKSTKMKDGGYLVMCQRPSETLFIGFLKEHLKVISEGDAVYKIYPKEEG